MAPAKRTSLRTLRVYPIAPVERLNTWKRLSALAVNFEVMVGRTISHYKLAEKLGEGGMGVVYKAEDTKLRREVALKFLNAVSLSDQETKTRFLREAQAAAALDHPNICGVYEIDEVDDKLFIAMPLLEGGPLEARIGQGPRPLAEVYDVSIQMAEALEAAHDKLIVHRDIKPANVMVLERARGRLHCVLMDFGLARLSQASKLTREGSQMGTAAYMSPEQVEGSLVDHRSDIWSLGVVIYEMAVGRPPFAAEYEQALFYGILNEQPEAMTALRTGTPMELERIVGKCLAKSPGERYQSCTDLLVDLHALKRSADIATSQPARAAVSTVISPPDSPTAAATMPETAGQSRGLGLLQAAGAALALAIVAAATTWLVVAPGPETAASPEYELTRITWDSGLSVFPSLSPDGRLLAYASDRGGQDNLDLWVQQIDGGGIIRVTDSPTDDIRPSFSPDGTKIVFTRMGEGIYVVPTLGGDPYLVAANGTHPAFSPDGMSVAYRLAGDLYYSPISMGDPVELLSEVGGIGPPLWAPDGAHVLAYARRRGVGPDWLLTPIDGSEPQPLGAREVFERSGLVFPYPEAWSWGAGGILFGESGELYVAPVDVESWSVSTPRRLTFGSGVEALPSGSQDGKIAFVNIEQRRDIWSLQLDPATGEAADEPVRVTEAESSDTAADIAADGSRIAYISNRWGGQDLWTKDLATGKETNLSNDTALQLFPVLSADGQRIAYATREGRKFAIYVRPFEGGIGRLLCDDCGPPRSWSPDGRWLLYDGPGSPGMKVLDTESSASSTILRSEGVRIRSGALSRDGKWIAFVAAADEGEGKLFVAPFQGSDQIATESWVEIGSVGQQPKPAWSLDGKILYFTSDRAGSLDIWMQRLALATKQPVGKAQIVRRFPLTRHSLALMQPQERRLVASKDRLVFPVSEARGSIWLMQPKPAEADTP